MTSYFNPGRNGVRKANYHLFRERLGIPLVAVELAYDEAFDLTEDDAEILIQIRGGAVLFQKERLLNVAINALPESARKVLWIDSDIIFGSADWPARLSEALDTYPIVQPFEKLHHMPRGWHAERLDEADAAYTWQSVAYAISEGELPGWPSTRRRRRPATAMRWAASGRRGATCSTGTASTTPGWSAAVRAWLPARPTEFSSRSSSART